MAALDTAGSLMSEVPLNLLRKVILVLRKIARNWYSQATQENCCTHLCTSICNSPIFSPCKPEVGSIIFYHSKWKSRIVFFLSLFEGVFENLIKSGAPSVLFFSPPTSQLTFGEPHRRPVRCSNCLFNLSICLYLSPTASLRADLISFRFFILRAHHSLQRFNVRWLW